MFSVFFFLPASLLPAINKEPIFKLKKKTNKYDKMYNSYHLLFPYVTY